MAYMSRKEYEKELTRIQLNNASIERKRKLRAERLKYLPKMRLPSTSKLLLWTAVLLCVEIIAFCEIAFVMTRDTSFLYALIGVPTTLVPTICSYYHKSKCENTEGGIVFETAMQKNGMVYRTDGSEEAVG